MRDAAGAVITEKVDSTNEPDRTTNYIQHQGQTIATMTRLAGAASPKKTQIFTDHLGSPGVVVAESVVTNHEYGPFGQQLSVPQHGGAHGYTDHEDDAATALTYMMARYYNQAAARFLTPDPARDFNPYRAACYNSYEYTANDPINAWDPDGSRINWIGSEEQVTIAVNLLNKAIELSYSKPAGDWLKVIRDSDHYVININLVTEDSNIFIGNFEKEAIDLNDIKTLPLKGPGLTQIGAIAHEVNEQYSKQYERRPKVPAHREGVSIEGSITGYNRVDQSGVAGDNNPITGIIRWISKSDSNQAYTQTVIITKDGVTISDAKLEQKEK